MHLGARDRETFVGKQRNFSLDAAGITCHGTVGTNYSVTWHNNADRVSGYCTSDCLGRHGCTPRGGTVFLLQFAV